MKLKIVHQNQESRKEENGLKKEALEMSEDQIRVSPTEDSMKENPQLLEPSPVSASDPLLVSGKRKRKPKELMIDEVSPIIIRRLKKKAPSSHDYLVRGFITVLLVKSSIGDDPISGLSSAEQTAENVKVEIALVAMDEFYPLLDSMQATASGGGTSMSKGDASVGRSGSSSVQMKSPTVIRAEEFQSSLTHEQPSFMKLLVRSHVGSCFWMGLPVPFCKVHLPTKDTTVILEDDNGEEFPIKYIAHKTGLSAGWRKFVAANKLIEGDVLVFQLTAPCRLKVYVIRANDLTEVDGALSLLILDSQKKQNDAAEGAMDAQSKKKRRPKSLPLTVVQKKHKVGLPSEEQSGNDSDEVASEVLEGTKFSESSFPFKDIKSFEEFHIMVNGACIDSDLPESIRRKYYDLCCSKNAFLHDPLLPGLYNKLASSMIVETIHIAEAIRGCKITTPRDDFEKWEKSLRSFELLGLNVGFLRARLHQLHKLAFETEDASEVRRYREALEEQNHVKDEIEKLEAKLVELNELSAKCDDDIENLKSKAESCELKFQQEAKAPW